MTTTSTRPTTSPDRARAARTVTAALACLGTAPYIALKTAWLTGSSVGLSDPALVHSGSMVALNGVTLGMDAVLVLLATALAARRGERLPAAVVLLPAWVATGLLLPIAVTLLPGFLVAGSALGGGDDGLAAWVRPMVYAGFTWQGAFLLLTFALYARARWSWVVAACCPGASDLQRTCAYGGAATAVLSAGLSAASGVTSGPATGVITGLVDAAFALAGAVGVVALLRPLAPRARTAAVVAGWCGSGSLFAWGLWTAVTTMGATDLSGAGDPLHGLASLTGLLAGFAMAVAGMLALVGRE